MTDTPYTPPKVWQQDTSSGGTFASINRPVAGPTHEKELPVGKHPLQLYSLATPNGVKVTIMLEELLALGHSGAEYDAWLIRISEGEQFSSGFVEINPNSKIPALLDRSHETPVRVFESGSILLYLAEKFSAFLPADPAGRTETLNWLFWQMGAAPYLGGGFGHFYAYAPEKLESTPSTGLRWRPNVSSTCWTVAWRNTTTWRATRIRLLISPCGHGMARWCATRFIRLPSSCRCMNTRTSSAGLRKLQRARQW